MKKGVQVIIIKTNPQRHGQQCKRDKLSGHEIFYVVNTHREILCLYMLKIRDLIERQMGIYSVCTTTTSCVPLQQVVLWDNFYAAEKCFCEMWPPPRLTWDALAYVKALKGFKSLHTVMSNGLLKLKGKTYPWERLSLVYAGKQDIKLYESYWIVKYISENAHSLC